jgi:chaperonin GroES
MPVPFSPLDTTTRIGPGVLLICEIKRGRGTLTEFVEPLGLRVLIRKDENRQQTRGGIVLPDHAEIPTITGRVVEISVQIENDPDFPISKYDKVLFNPKNAIPVDFEPDNLLFVVPIDDLIAVFRRSPASAPRVNSSDESDEYDDEFDE